MSQTLQQQLLLSKSMNGIIVFDDGAGTTISNGQVVTNGVNTGTMQTNTLLATDMSLNNLTVAVSADVPTMPTGDNSNNAANTAFVQDAILQFFPQDAYIIRLLDNPTSYIGDLTVNNAIDNNTVHTIQLADETTFSFDGYRFNIFPNKPWSSLGASITVNTITGSKILYNGQIVSSFTMSANNPSISVINIDRSGSTSGVGWVVTDRDPNGVLLQTNTWTGTTNTFLQQSGLLARSSWATGGVIANLNRDVGKCLTPIDYNTTTKEWSINDETNGGVLTIDISNSVLSSGLGINDFAYDVKIGRDLINLYGDHITPTQLGYLSAINSEIVDMSSGQNIFGIKYVMNQWTFGTPPVISGGYVNTTTAQTIGGDKTLTGNTQTNSLTVNFQLYLGNNTDINWQYSALDNSVTMKDGFGTPILRINNDTLTSSIGSIAIGQYASFNQIGQIPTNSNLAIGYQALYNNMTAGGNTCFGYQSGYSLTSGDSNTFIGDLAGKFATSASECVGIGGGCFRSVQNIGNRCVGIGFNTFPQCTGTLGASNLAIGAGAGAVITGTGAASVTSCVFIGVNSGVNSNTTSYTNSVAIGFNSRITANNQIVLGGASNAVTYTPAWFQKRNMIWRDSPAVLNANLDISASTTNFYSYYPVNLTANRTVTLPPNTSSNWSGLEITFRRVGTGSSANQLLASTNDVLPAGSTTAQNVILGAGQHYVKIVNLLISTGLYQWCVVSIG